MFSHFSVIEEVFMFKIFLLTLALLSLTPLVSTPSQAQCSYANARELGYCIVDCLMESGLPEYECSDICVEMDWF